jgi:signal transduction histidine kinase
MDLSIVRPSLVPDIRRIGALDMALVYPNGTAYYVLENTTADLGDREYVKQAMTGKNSIGVVFSRVTNQLVVMFAAPVFQSDAAGAPVAGVLISRKDGGRTLSDIAINLKSAMPSGYSYLVDSDGTFIAHPNTEMVTSQFNPITEAEHNPSLKSMADMIETALEKRNGISHYTFEGKKMIGRYAEVPGYPWVLFSSIERRDIDRQLTAMRVILLIISFIVSVILAGALVFFGSRSVFISIEEREKVTREAIERKMEIERLMDALKKSTEARTAFLSDISGSMADPINNIIRLSSLLSKYTEITEDHHKNMDTINDEGMKLFTVINDILDILNIEAGKLKFKPVKYNLPKLISDITIPFLVHTKDKPIKYRLVVDEHLPVNLAGDELRIKQITHHLITNAFNFTQRGTITVDVTSKSKGEHIMLIIKVIDTGIGMTESKMDSIFADYGQGTGKLGLFLCRQLAEIMKGSLSVISERDKGSMFTLSVPQKLLSHEAIGHETAKELAAFKYNA